MYFVVQASKKIHQFTNRKCLIANQRNAGASQIKVFTCFDDSPAGVDALLKKAPALKIEQENFSFKWRIYSVNVKSSR